MSLLFSHVTQDFVSFGTALQEFKQNTPAEEDSTRDQLQAAAAGFKHSAALNASYPVYIGVGMFVRTYLYMLIWAYTGEVGTRRLRERYLKAILCQDIAYFDNVGAGEVATCIQTDTRVYQSILLPPIYFLLPIPLKPRVPRTLLISDPIFPDLVQQGTSEKVALVVNFLAAFVTGFVLAYVRSWRLALAMSSMLPCIAIAGSVMNKFLSKYM